MSPEVKFKLAYWDVCFLAWAGEIKLAYCDVCFFGRLVIKTGSLLCFFSLGGGRSPQVIRISKIEHPPI